MYTIVVLKLPFLFTGSRSIGSNGRSPTTLEDPREHNVFDTSGPGHQYLKTNSLFLRPSSARKRNSAKKYKNFRTKKSIYKSLSDIVDFQVPDNDAKKLPFIDIKKSYAKTHKFNAKTVSHRDQKHSSITTSNFFQNLNSPNKNSGYNDIKAFNYVDNPLRDEDFDQSADHRNVEIRISENRPSENSAKFIGDRIEKVLVRRSLSENKENPSTLPVTDFVEITEETPSILSIKRLTEVNNNKPSIVPAKIPSILNGKIHTDNKPFSFVHENTKQKQEDKMLSSYTTAAEEIYEIKAPGRFVALGGPLTITVLKG